MTSLTPISHWLVLGPIFNPDHPTEHHHERDQHPQADEIITDIENNALQLEKDIDKKPLKPKVLTRSLENAPEAGKQNDYGTGKFFPFQRYSWKELHFNHIDWNNPHDIEDNLHRHLPSGLEPNNPDHPESFAGKHHCLAFFLTYIYSPDDQTTQLCVRSDDSIRVWLNGEELDEPLKFVGDRNITADSPESCAEIPLRKGWNILLAAVAETQYEWGFSARINNAID